MTDKPNYLFNNQAPILRMLDYFSRPNEGQLFYLPMPAATIECLRDQCDRAVEDMISMGNEYKHYRSFFENVGIIAHHLQGPYNHDDFATMLCEKHMRYGLSSISRWGSLGIAMRIDSKQARLTNMATDLDLKHKLGMGDETVIDTLQDIVGYAIVGILLRNREVNNAR